MIATVTDYWLIPNASSQPYGIAGDDLINWIHIFMVLLFVGWGGFFLYCLVRYRARPGGRAIYAPIKAKISKYVEVAIVIFEGFVLLGISVPAWNAFKHPPADAPNTIEIRVVGHQFQWEFHLPGPDGKFGRTALEFHDMRDGSAAPGENPLGLDDTDPAAWDDIWSSGILKLPNKRTMIVNVSSLDVIHGFGIPAMRVKQDAIPGMNIPVWFIPKTLGTYDIVCSQLCGSSHYKMGAKLSIVSDAEYEQWLEEVGPFVPEEYRPDPQPTPEGPQDTLHDKGDDPAESPHDGHHEDGSEGHHE